MIVTNSGTKHIGAPRYKKTLKLNVIDQKTIRETPPDAHSPDQLILMICQKSQNLIIVLHSARLSLYYSKRPPRFLHTSIMCQTQEQSRDAYATTAIQIPLINAGT